jgi:oligopeptide transport system substrate-binding protein
MRNRPLSTMFCAVVIAASCQSTTPSPTPPQDARLGSPAPASADMPPKLAAEQILRVDIGGEPESLDPTALGAPEVLRALQRPLVQFNENQEVVSALAEKWEISDDGMTLTFDLREAQYSNGDPIVAGDLVYSARRLADPRTKADYAYVMGRVVGGPELLAMAGAHPSDADIEAALQKLGVSAPDDRTFVVQLVRPAPHFLSELALYVLVPLQEDWIISPEATEAGNFVSSGPFILDTWDHESRIVLKPNPFWWGDVKPTLNEIQMSMAGPADAMLAYEAGELDIAEVPSEDVERVKPDPVFAAEYREVRQQSINFYSFNTLDGPTANKDFRIALTQSIDKQALIESTWAGLGQAANSVVMPGIPGHQPDLNPYPYDLDAARRHMDKALAGLGVSSAAQLGAVTLRFPSGSGNDARFAFLAEAWRQAFGLESKLVGTDRSVFLEDRWAGAFDISNDGWGADYPHAVNQLDGLFTCLGGNNHSKYCNPAFDALLDRAAAEPDPDRQVATYEEAQTLLMNDAPILPVRFGVRPYAIKSYVAGVTPMLTDFWVAGDYHYETIQILEH